WQLNYGDCLDVWAAFGPYAAPGSGSTMGVKRLLCLEATAVKRVLPFWEAAWPHDRTPWEGLGLAGAYLQDRFGLVVSENPELRLWKQFCIPRRGLRAITFSALPAAAPAAAPSGTRTGRAPARRSVAPAGRRASGTTASAAPSPPPPAPAPRAPSASARP